MKIAMANDHAGTQMKEEIKAYLIAQGHEVEDFGTYDNASCDLSDFVYPAALAVARRGVPAGRPAGRRTADPAAQMPVRPPASGNAFQHIRA